MKFEFRKKKRSSNKVFKNPLITLEADTLEEAKERFLSSSAKDKINSKIHVIEIKRIE